MGAIPVFVAVAECGGFAAAGRRLGVTTSAVSKRITALEAQLSTQLFHRSTRNISLTEAGERYLAYAIQALSAARDGENAVLELQGAPAGRLRINAPMSFGRLHIAPLIPGFLKAHPGIEIDLMMDDRVVDLFKDGYDIAIRAGELQDSALIARRLAVIRSLIVASPAYLADRGTPAHPAELTGHVCLHYAYSRDPQEWVFATGDGELRVRTSGSVRVNNSEALGAALAGGAGVGRLPSFIAGPLIAEGRLVRLLPGCALPEQALYAVFPERRHIPQKVRTFVDYVKTAIGGAQPIWDRQAGLAET